MYELIILPLCQGMVVVAIVALILYSLVKICKKYPKVDFGIGLMMIVVGLTCLSWLIGHMIQIGFFTI